MQVKWHAINIVDLTQTHRAHIRKYPIANINMQPLGKRFDVVDAPGIVLRRGG
jgi:hypothetical protein